MCGNRDTHTKNFRVRRVSVKKKKKKEIKTCIQHGYIKLIKSNCTDIYNVTKDFKFKQRLFIDISINSFHKNKTGILAEN